jgi:hypothetical protein
MLIIFFDFKGIVNKEFALSGQTLSVKMCEDFTPNFGNKRTGCCITSTHHLTLPFSPGNFFYQKTT